MASMLPFMMPQGATAMLRGGLMQKPPAAKPAGMFGLDPMTWLSISAALAQGAEGGGWSQALSGVHGALQGRQQRQEETDRSGAQQRALALMQLGDMKGAIRVLGAAKGLESDAFNMGARLHERDDERSYSREEDDRLYRRDRGDYVADRDEGRSYERSEGDRLYGRDRGDRIEDREDRQRHDFTTRTPQGTDWEKVTDKDGKVMWVRPGTNISVDSGIEAPGAQSRSLLGAEATARAIAGIPGAKEAIARMEGMEAEGYKPEKDWGARAIGAVPLPFMDQAAAFVGGEDFQSYKQAFAQFEATMMPILSGANVVESEARRLLNAVKPELEDTPQTLTLKSSQRRRMTDALALALEGDRGALNAMLQEYQDGGPSAPGAGDEIPTISSPQQAAQLPPGTLFRAPDGSIKRVPGAGGMR
jgi:hypothetical protein